ncbi:hypothetical protein AWL63_06320 [Sphingomonas panacis]|uniref:Uncharacterized protein n=1 Tax=Sphingomonas panacis TaxID=1560345 RepID=A0A1B3Z890_9SPHN|nr:hypothetical protein [Sphingomonas panacis]AOH83646.1 hypothetical protein AWL63_06320 [Sphingomonas panacis]
MFDPTSITTHPRKSPAEIRAVALQTVFPLAERITNSEPLMRVYCAIEWGELDEGGQEWISAIVRETLACAAAGNTQLYNIGERTMAQVFNAAGLTHMSDMQAVLDAVESALAQTNKTAITDEQILAAMQHRPSGIFTYVIRNVLASELHVQRSAISVAKVRRRLHRLEAAGRVRSKNWGPGCAHEWIIVR